MTDRSYLIRHGQGLPAPPKNLSAEEAILKWPRLRFVSRLAMGLQLIGVVVGGVVRAQDLEPRSYVNTPVGMNFLIASYAYSEGGVATDPSLPIEDADIHLNTFVIGYARALDVFGDSGKIDIVLPSSNLSGSALVEGEKVTRNVTGFGDPRFRLSVNLYGAPALSLKDFADYHQNILVGASFQLTPPLGQYDTSKAVNIGTNRWSFTPGLGVSKAIGQFRLELSTNITWYTENTDFFGGHTLDQDPLFSVQAHVSYNFGRGMWAAIDGTYYRGGSTTINDVAGNNLQENTRIGATFAMPVNKYNSIKLFVSTGVSTRTGSNFTTGGVAWQYRWGGGL